MVEFIPSLGQDLAEHPEFLAAWRHALERNLMNIDPWVLYSSDGQVAERTSAVNGRYSARKVLCFAEREDTDDVACLVLQPDEHHPPGRVLIVHDFAKAGSEVDAEYRGFWEWFRSAVDDMIDTFDHWKDPR